VIFDDESEQMFDLLKLDLKQSFDFEAKQTQRIIFEIYDTF